MLKDFITMKTIKNRIKVALSWVLSFSTFLPLGGLGWALVSCSDILETESTRQNIDPTIGDKTDSVFYAYGILQAMQQLADQYGLQGEMRGDLVKTTFYTDKNLRELYNFSATTENKYDSAYVYYRVINNCNYYIAHCDTALYTGSTNVIIDKYVAAKSIRAWAYLQLGRNYQRVPFFTEPLTQISQIDRDYPELTLSELVDRLAPDLEQYTGYKVPTFGYPSTSQFNTQSSPNWESANKQFLPRLCFIPVDVVLGDMYLEAGNYDAAARHFITYLVRAAQSSDIYSAYMAPNASKYVNTGGFGRQSDDSRADNSLMTGEARSTTSWSNIFARNSISDIISYIPMATTSQNGPTTNLPLTFGFDYYSTPEETGRSGAPYIDAVQLLPSDVLNALSDSTEYYYYASHGSSQTDQFDSVSIARVGDMRLRSILHQELEDDSTKQWIDKYKYANIVLYRTSMVWLRLAEAFNRLGMYDAAFAILKDGITENVTASPAPGEYYMDYISAETRQKLQTTYPLLSTQNVSLFPRNNGFGIHTHGAGRAASDYPGVAGSLIAWSGSNTTGGSTYHTGTSPYKLSRIAGMKLEEIAKQFGVAVGTTKQDTINAVEDLICDEYALELAFEGTRWYDLKRLARHKNEAGLYDPNFGGKWLAKKLAFKNPVVNLEDKNNWYLPFK